MLGVPARMMGVEAIWLSVSQELTLGLDAGSAFTRWQRQLSAEDIVIRVRKRPIPFSGPSRATVRNWATATLGRHSFVDRCLPVEDSCKKKNKNNNNRILGGF